MYERLILLLLPALPLLLFITNAGLSFRLVSAEQTSSSSVLERSVTQGQTWQQKLLGMLFTARHHAVAGKLMKTLMWSRSHQGLPQKERPGVQPPLKSGLPSSSEIF